MTELLQQTADLYPIRTVSAITGINPVTLRAWERRYGLVKPRRTDTGHRVYSARDIDKINRAIALVERGHSISQVAAMLEAASNSVAAPDDVAGNTWSDYRTRMLTAISAFREDELDEIYNEILALFSLSIVNSEVIVPLLKQLGERWETGAGSIAEEHFFAFYLRNKLGARFHHRGQRNLGPLLISACLPRDSHEAGLLLFSLAALDQGYRLVNLGANMPMEDLPMVARRAGADGLVLSGRMQPENDILGRQLAQLVHRSPVPVFIGGRVSTRHHDRIEQSGAFALGDDIEHALSRLENHFSKPVAGHD